MMEPTVRYYGVGEQNFAKLRNNHCVYVDKTELIYRLVTTPSYYFLSRPRRFGKSLLISTLEAYFCGKKDLFKGLAIDNYEKEWAEHVVLRLDMSRGKYYNELELNAIIESHLSEWEELYGAPKVGETFSVRFANVIKRAYKQSSRGVVVLIDEYDSALLDSNLDKALQDKLRMIMRSLYSPLKDCGQYMRFLFITGITKFSQMSIFSELNNLTNISMDPQYDALCGITADEIITQLKPDVGALAMANNETFDKAVAHLKQKYDGYHFSEGMTDIFNPFSVIHAFAQKKYKNYWHSTGTPTFLVDLIREQQVFVPQLDGITLPESAFDKSTDCIDSVIPVLYQSGYLTIKGYECASGFYTLGFPNQEVQEGLMEVLLKDLYKVNGDQSPMFIWTFTQLLAKHNLDACMHNLKVFFAEIPAVLDNKTERHYQTILFLIFKLMGQFVDVEVHTSLGRADMVVKVTDAIYLFEFKLDKSTEEAMYQIEDRGYIDRFLADKRKKYKIAVNFSSAKRNIDGWEVVEA